MDEERRLAPRRLLSFDASQVSLARIGKAIYSAAATPSGAQLAVDEFRSRRFEVPQDASYRVRGAVQALAPSPSRRFAAIASKESLEVLDLGSGSAPSATCTTKLDKKYLPTALVWGQHQLASTLALATSGGTLALYSVSDNKGLELQLPTVKLGLGLSLNSLDFLHVAPGNLLLGASSDGAVRLWDLRLAPKKPAIVFQRPGDIAREVAMKPDSDTKFAAIYDSGIVHCWDLRHGHQPDLRINAHQQGLCLDWHPTENYLATGGRDKLLQVWAVGQAVGQAVASPAYTISTPSAISKTRWMPTSSAHGGGIANAALVTCGRAVPGMERGTYSYWQLSRPFCPSFVVEKHTAQIADLAAVSPTTVWSAGRDGLVAVTDVRNEPRVDANFSPALFCWSSTNMCATAFPDRSVAAFVSSPSPSPGLSSHRNSSVSHSRPQAVSRVSGGGGNTGAVHPQLHTSYLHGTSSEVASPSSTDPNPSTALNSAATSTVGTPSLASPLPPSTGVSPSNNRFAPLMESDHSVPSQTAPTFNPSFADRDDYFSLQKRRSDRGCSPIVIMNMPYEDGQARRKAANELIFDRPDHWTYGEVCRHNSHVMSSVGRYRTSQTWLALGTAVDALQREFVANLESPNDAEIARRWFQCVRDEPIVSETIDTTKNDDDDDDTPPPQPAAWPRSNPDGLSPHSAPSMSGLSLHYRQAEHHHQAEEPARVAEVCAMFYDYAVAQTQPWQFMPMLVVCTNHSLDTSLELTTIALLALFRHFRSYRDTVRVNELEVSASAIRLLRSQGSFVPAAKLSGIVKTPASPEFELDAPDTICAHCGHPLSDNAAFMAGDDGSVGFWYCGHCKRLLDGCAFCNETLKGLAVVILDCGHKTHRDCWQLWLDQAVPECPAGCGQLI